MLGFSSLREMMKKYPDLVTFLLLVRFRDRPEVNSEGRLRILQGTKMDTGSILRSRRFELLSILADNPYFFPLVASMQR
jgi:hypothetical protein